MTDLVHLEEIAKQRLADLLKSGTWMLTGNDGADDGRMANGSVWLNGLRVWTDGSADSLVVEAFDSAHAQRTDVTGNVVWRSNPGHLANVLSELLELNPPDKQQTSPGEPGAASTAVPTSVPGSIA